MSFEKVEFKTLDGMLLRGNLYPAKDKGPGIILTPGEMMITTVAAEFQANAITALVYDPRGLGESDGSPRNELDPAIQAQDYSDAFTFLSSQPTVKPDQIGLWGLSFNGLVAIAAAASDPRVRFVIASCPWLKYFASDKLPSILSSAALNREYRVRGGDPVTVPIWNEDGSPVFDAPDPEGRKSYKVALKAMSLGLNYTNNVTLETFSRMAQWNPGPLIDRMDATPVMVLVPELDALSPVGDQLRFFEKLRCPKRLHVAKGKDHFNLLSGSGVQEMYKDQVMFIHNVLNSRVDAKL